MATQCPVCKGKKYTESVNFLKARREKVLCKGCNGAGVIQEAQREGVRCGRCIAETFFWQDLSEGKPIATLEIRVRPIMDEFNRPSYTPPTAFGLKPRPRVFLEIVRMNTKIQYRKQGRMHKLMANALMDPKIEWAVSSWEDSTADGRNFLLGCGFRQSGSDLIWRRDEQPEELGPDTGSIPSGPEQP